MDFDENWVINVGGGKDFSEEGPKGFTFVFVECICIRIKIRRRSVRT